MTEYLGIISNHRADKLYLSFITFKERKETSAIKQFGLDLTGVRMLTVSFAKTPNDLSLLNQCSRIRSKAEIVLSMLKFN